MREMRAKRKAHLIVQYSYNTGMHATPESMLLLETRNPANQKPRKLEPSPIPLKVRYFVAGSEEPLMNAVSTLELFKYSN